MREKIIHDRDDLSRNAPPHFNREFARGFDSIGGLVSDAIGIKDENRHESFLQIFAFNPPMAGFWRCVEFVAGGEHPGRGGFREGGDGWQMGAIRTFIS
jgi:hypothetical protein